MAGVTKKEMEDALEKSRLYLEEQRKPPSDSHVKATTPTKAEMEAALEQSADYLEKQGYRVTRGEYEPGPAASTPVPAATPGVSFSGTQYAPDAAPVDASRDTSQDSAPMTARDNATSTEPDKKKD